MAARFLDAQFYAQAQVEFFVAYARPARHGSGATNVRSRQYLCQCFGRRLRVEFGLKTWDPPLDSLILPTVTHFQSSHEKSDDSYTLWLRLFQWVCFLYESLGGYNMHILCI